jgi:hypothetical protein
MPARPQLDTSALDEIFQALNRGEVVPPFTVKRLERRVEQLRGAGALKEYWTARVGLAALTWQVDEAIALAEKAHLVLGDQPKVLTNLAAMLSGVSALPQAMFYSRLAHDVAPAYHIGMWGLFANLEQLGRLTEAVQAAQDFVARVGPDQAGDIPERIAQARKRVEGLQAAGVPEEVLQSELIYARQVAQEQQVRVIAMTTHNDMDHDSDAERFIVRLIFRGDIEREIELESELAPRLATVPGWNPTKLAVGFAYLEDEHLPA